MVNIASSTDYYARVPRIFNKLGRFEWVRLLKSNVKKFNNINHRVVNFTSILTENIDFEACLKQINQTAVYQGFYLRENLVSEILDFAIQNECIEPQSNKNFYINSVKLDYIYRGLVTGTDKCQAISQVKHNYACIEIAKRFLGYTPTKITQHLTWSLPVSVAESVIQQHYPASRWHYDVVGENSLTINFYITAVDSENSGAHQFVPTSHKNQPLQLLFKPNTVDEETLDKYFPHKQKVSIIGAAGYGFIENPLCMHRVKPPLHQPRLILQIRYS